MKEKILTLIIGILIGAILATGGFFIYTKVTESSSEQNTTQNGGPRQGEMQNDGERPELPNGQAPSGEKTDGEPPAKPGESTNTENSNNANNSNQS